MTELSENLKLEIQKHTTKEQGDIYKLYISKSKNTKHSTMVREEASKIAQYALKIHNQSLRDIEIAKKEIEDNFKKERKSKTKE